MKKDSDKDVRQAAAQALSAVAEGDQVALVALVKACGQDEDVVVRRRAKEILKSITTRGNKAATTALIDLIEALKADKHEWVSYHARALASIGERGGEAATAALIENMLENLSQEKIPLPPGMIHRDKISEQMKERQRKDP
eukprot:4608378-Amphidinium_carterae.1